jgi:hypothetical protein
VVDELTSTGANVPPDWATVDAGGHASAHASPLGESPRFGFEALRVPIRMAASGTDYGRGLAARTWHLFSALPPTRIGQVYELDGRPQARGQHAAMLSAAAAAAGAAVGEGPRSRELLARAAAVDRATPTYYGAAWLVLTDLVIRGGLAGGPA